MVGLGVLASETGHVPLLYRTYSGNSSDQAVLTACLDGLRVAPVAGRRGGACKGAADTGEGWRFLESSIGTGSGCCWLLQPDLVASRTCGGGAGATDGRPARRDEALDRQTGPGARRGCNEGRQPGPHAGGGREQGTAEGQETRHCGGVVQKHHLWSTGRIVQAFRGQWNVEELFRRAKKGGVVPWGPSHQWADGSIRLHTFATVLGLMLVSLAKIALGTSDSALAMMTELAEIRATLVRTTTRGPGRRATVMIAPELSTSQRRAVKVFELDRWMPTLLSCMTTRPINK